jgi:hypothetical protein
MRAYLQEAYGTRDQLAHGLGTTIPHVAPLMRATLATKLRCIRGHNSLIMLTKKNFAFLIPAPKTSLILLASCPVRGAS